jgi:hypothetical protein
MLILNFYLETKKKYSFKILYVFDEIKAMGVLIDDAWVPSLQS